MTNTLVTPKKWLERAISNEDINNIGYDKFTNHSKIGKGGFATVYKCEWKDCGSTVALKCIKDDFINEVSFHN